MCSDIKHDKSMALFLSIGSVRLSDSCFSIVLSFNLAKALSISLLRIFAKRLFYIGKYILNINCEYAGGMKLSKSVTSARCQFKYPYAFFGKNSLCRK